MMRYIKTDLRLFRSGIVRLKSAVVEGGLQGMRSSLEALRDDCFNIPPTAPLKDGALRAAHKIKVTSVPGGIIGELTVKGISYAASLHEGISRWGTPYMKWTTPGSGSHWISSKNLMFQAKYTHKLAEGIRQVFRMIKIRGHFRQFGTIFVKPFLRKIRLK